MVFEDVGGASEGLRDLRGVEVGGWGRGDGGEDERERVFRRAGEGRESEGGRARELWSGRGERKVTRSRMGW